MQWSAAAHAGFGRGVPWLAPGDDFEQRNVEAQRADLGSLLNLYHDLLALRRQVPALHRGRYQALDAPEGVFAYERACEGSRARIAGPGAVGCGRGDSSCRRCRSDTDAIVRREQAV